MAFSDAKAIKCCTLKAMLEMVDTCSKVLWKCAKFDYKRLLQLAIVHSIIAELEQSCL